MQERHLRRAIALANHGMTQGFGGPFGAVVVRGGEIVAEGHNQVTSDNDPTAHAEMVAIRAACRFVGSFSLSGLEIYSSCEPCPMCLSAIYWARLDRLYFAATRKDAAGIGFDDDFLYTELGKGSSERKLITEQALRDEAVHVMQGFHKMPADRRY